MEAVTVMMIAVGTVVVVVTMTTAMAATTPMVAVVEITVAMTTDTAEAVAVDASTAGTMGATITVVMITVTTMALTEAVLLVAAVVTAMVLVKNATLVEVKNAVVEEAVKSAVAVATMTVMPTLPATNRPLPVKAANPTTVVAAVPAVDLTKVAERKDTAAGKLMITVDLDMTCRGTWKGFFWLSPSSLFSSFHFFIRRRKLRFFVCILRYIHFCFVLGSGAKGYGRQNALIISPHSITSVRSDFRKRKLSRLWHVYRVSAVRKTSPEQIYHTIDLYQLSTQSCRPHKFCAPP